MAANSIGKSTLLALEAHTMYIPDHFKETSLPVLHAIIREHPLGILVTQAGGLDANHLPFELDASRGSSGTLVAHVARANPIWHTVPSDSDVMVIFRRAQAYISPSWYPSKHDHHKQVEGRLKVSQDEDKQDRLGTVEGLRHTSHAPAQTLSDLVLRELTKSEGGSRKG